MTTQSNSPTDAKVCYQYDKSGFCYEYLYCLVLVFSWVNNSGNRVQVIAGIFFSLAVGALGFQRQSGYFLWNV